MSHVSAVPAADEDATAPGLRPTGVLPQAVSSVRDMRRLWWYTAGGLIVFAVWIAVFLAVVLVHPPRTGLAIGAVTVALLLACLGGQGALIRRHRRLEEEQAPGLRLVTATLVPALAVAGLPLLRPVFSGWPVLSSWLTVCLLSTVVVPRWRSPVLTFGAATTAASAAIAVLRDPAGPQDSALGLAIWWVMIPLVVLPSVWFWRIALRLEQARGQAAELAVLGERLRFAADLHDVQGHHLQVVALHAELAARLLEAGDPDGAAAALAQVRGQAAEALGETRALVSDLRRVSLAQEIDNARAVLEAAGSRVRVDLEGEATRLGEAAERVLGLAVREATTNVLRHARAGRVDLRLEADGPDRSRLSVVNDGAPGRMSEDSAVDAGVGAGTGLAALAERAEAAGGSLRAGPGAGEASRCR